MREETSRSDMRRIKVASIETRRAFDRLLFARGNHGTTMSTWTSVPCMSRWKSFQTSKTRPPRPRKQRRDWLIMCRQKNSGKKTQFKLYGASKIRTHGSLEVAAICEHPIPYSKQNLRSDSSKYHRLGWRIVNF